MPGSEKRHSRRQGAKTLPVRGWLVHWPDLDGAGRAGAPPRACAKALDQLDRWGDKAGERFRGALFFAKEGLRLKSLTRELRARRAAEAH